MDNRLIGLLEDENRKAVIREKRFDISRSTRYKDHISPRVFITLERGVDKVGTKKRRLSVRQTRF